MSVDQSFNKGEQYAWHVPLHLTYHTIPETLVTSDNSQNWTKRNRSNEVRKCLRTTVWFVRHFRWLDFRKSSVARRRDPRNSSTTIWNEFRNCPINRKDVPEVHFWETDAAIVTILVFVLRFCAENYSELAATVVETVNFPGTVSLPSKIHRTSIFYRVLTSLLR